MRHVRAPNEPRAARARRTGMQQIGEATARVFKALAGVEKDKPADAWVYALYGFLFCIAFMLVLGWLIGPAA